MVGSDLAILLELGHHVFGLGGSPILASDHDGAASNTYRAVSDAPDLHNFPLPFGVVLVETGPYHAEGDSFPQESIDTAHRSELAFPMAELH